MRTNLRTEAHLYVDIPSQMSTNVGIQFHAYWIAPTNVYLIEVEYHQQK